MPGLGSSLGEGKSNPLQYSCLENSMDKGAWQATVHGVTSKEMQLSEHENTHTHTHTHNRGHLTKGPPLGMALIQ